MMGDDQWLRAKQVIAADMLDVPVGIDDVARRTQAEVVDEGLEGHGIVSVLGVDQQQAVGAGKNQ